MATNHASHDSTANPTKDAPSSRGRDTLARAQDDSTDADNNKPPNHGVPTHGVSRFLWECDKDTPVEELGQRYREWKQDGEQSEISRWSK